MTDASCRYRCACGRFLRDVRYRLNGLDEVVECKGTCKKHGRVDVTDYDYEELVRAEWMEMKP